MIDAIAPLKRFRPFVLVEGVYLPCTSLQVSANYQGAAVIQAHFKYHPSLDEGYFRFYEPGSNEFGPGALPRLVRAELDGIQPGTIMQAFVLDVGTGEEIFLQEGRVVAPSVSETPRVKSVQLTATGWGSYQQDVYSYMIDQGQVLALEAANWRGRLGTMTAKEVSSILKEKGLGQGILELMEKAGLNSTVYLHILWKMFRLKRRSVLVDNPKALGYFSGDRMDQILAKTLDKMSSSAPIEQLILYVLQILRYYMVNTLAPSFIDAKYSGEGALENVELTNADEAIMNDMMYFPDMTVAPPPRCNVIFPCQYTSYTNNQRFPEMPTRMIVRIHGRGALTGDYNQATTLIEPQEVSDGIQAEGRYYNSFEERYRGVHHANLGQSAPEWAMELGADYMKGFASQEWAKTRMGHVISIGGGPLNLRLIPGLPGLLLKRDGRHKVCMVDQVSHTITHRTATTNVTLSRAWPYNMPVDDNGGDLWYEHNFFAPEYIGTYMYPKLIGQYYESGIISALAPDAEQEDMSILRHLNTYGMTEDEVKEARADPLAIQKATDALYEEYRATASKTQYAYQYGRRRHITRKQLLENFYHAKCLPNYEMCTGGYTLETNAVNLVEATAEQLVGGMMGEFLDGEIDIAGCYVRERQAVYVPAYISALEMKGLPVDISQQTENPNRQERTRDDLMDSVAALQDQLLEQALSELNPLDAYRGQFNPGGS